METCNSARFCAKYVKFVGIASTPRTPYYVGYGDLVVNNVKFTFTRGYNRDYKVGDIVHIAVLIPTVRSEPLRWSIHQIRLAERFFYYHAYEQRSPKQKRMFPYVPVADTSFKRGTFIIEKA